MVKETVKAKDGTNTIIVLVSPVHIQPDAPRFMEFYEADYSVECGEASVKLADVVCAVAQHEGCIFVDASEVATVGEDGLHLNKESNKRLAEKLANIVR